MSSLISKQFNDFSLANYDLEKGDNENTNEIKKNNILDESNSKLKRSFSDESIILTDKANNEILSSSILNISKNLSFYVVDFEKIDEKKEKDILFNYKYSSECLLYDDNNASTNYIIKFLPQSFRFVLYGKDPKINTNYSEKYFYINLLGIYYYYSCNYMFQPSYYTVQIKMKDERTFNLKIPKNKFDIFNEIINKYTFPFETKRLFVLPYINKIIHKGKAIRGTTEFKDKNLNNTLLDFNGWDIYDFNKDFKTDSKEFKDNFQIYDNSSFVLCSSYPSKIVLPKNLSIAEIKKCALYRTKERLPILTYRHSNGCCIWRSSQPKNGFSGKKAEDFNLFRLISNGKKLTIFDCRPYMNACFNKLIGNGFENVNSYPGIEMKLIFCGIQNIHEVRKSWEQLWKNISYTDSPIKLFKLIEDSNWYNFINTMIKSAIEISSLISSGESNVLIHCSDGWDRTSQLVSLSRLLLDPESRDIWGFASSIERDWLNAGHMFRYRGSLISGTEEEGRKKGDNERSMVFIQFLDAVFQLSVQNITKFGFNTELLYYIACEMYTGNFGTFMFNNEKERQKFRAKEKTLSIWTYVKLYEDKFKNILYDPKNIEHNEKIVYNYKKITLWERYFLRYEKNSNRSVINYNIKFENANNQKEKLKRIIENLVSIINKHEIIDNDNTKIEDSELTKETLSFLNKNNLKIKNKGFNDNFELINKSDVIKAYDKENNADDIKNSNSDNLINNKNIFETIKG